MVFPLLFPRGDLGWSLFYHKNDTIQKLKKKKGEREKYLSVLQYYAYRLSYRPNSTNFSPLLYAGRLTQQYFLHAYILVESNRMNFFRAKQSQLRIECYQGLLDHINASAANRTSNLKLGDLFILPSTYIGGPRYMQQHYQDAMAIMRAVKRPDLFITMTCNPKWEELTELLKHYPPGSQPNDIPNLTVRLFWTKFNELLYDITENYIFGVTLAYVYTIEFQKRGLPHAHLIVTLRPDNDLKNIEKLDSYISAEIPSKSNDPELYQCVTKLMLHGPHHNKSPCKNKNGKICKKIFPKPFRDSTTFQKNGYPLYRRRDNSNEDHFHFNKIIKKMVPVDNSMVVPYNSFLLKKYKCHINIEYCASINSIKYIFNYIHKGGDRASCKIQKKDKSEIIDEIKNFIDGRYLSPMEAA